MPDISRRAERERRLVVAIRQQLGPVICGALDDPEVIEVMLNPSGEVSEDRLGSGMRVICTMDPIAAHSFIGIVASTLHTTVARESPLLQAELPIRGARFQAAIRRFHRFRSSRFASRQLGFSLGRLRCIRRYVSQAAHHHRGLCKCA